MDNSSRELGFAASLLHAFESAVGCFFSPCHLFPMHHLLALGGGKLMVVHGSGTDTSLAAKYFAAERTQLLGRQVLIQLGHGFSLCV